LGSQHAVVVQMSLAIAIAIGLIIGFIFPRRSAH
jgi:hypothetical protein